GGGTLYGTVKDPSEAVIAGAEVTLVDEQTGSTRTALTDDEGVYRFDPLEPGTYTLQLAMPGFETEVRKGVAVQDGAGRSADAVLGPAEALTGVVVATIEPSEPLVRAASAGDLAEVRRLLAGGADANVVDNDTGTSALAQAVSNGNREIVVELLRAGAEVNARAEFKQTALMRLSQKTSQEVVRELLLAGARVNARDEDGFTALMAAAGWGAEGVAEALLRAGARVNARNKSGSTPLMHAAMAGRSDNVRALVGAGAELDLRDEDGATALKLARDHGHSETADLLVAYGATDDGAQAQPGEAAAESRR
ncbi:MAG TPA: ankyrin repeat domain-containing protein, partial [Pyrinomonadaceae bacterium]|nr:ankyrin repeat domain-containing protein [Pyrinomonadaceae bacterium]